MRYQWTFSMKMIPKTLTYLGLLAILCNTPILAQEVNRRFDKPLFRVGVDTVFLSVSVSDPLDRFVTGLDRDAFRVYEDKVEQRITLFTTEQAPISVGILFDRSASMKDNSNIQAARAALARFMESANPEDEFFLETFNQEPKVVTDWTHESTAVAAQVAIKEPRGQTALYDAVYLGLEKMKEARNDRKALILITDGEDNSSRYSPSEVKELARESGIQIYAVGEQGLLGYGQFDIEEIVQMTGGRAFFPSSFNDLDYYIDLIHEELRNQYILGYIPVNKARDGKWRKIEVKLDAPEGLPKLIVRTREGYYAPKN